MIDLAVFVDAVDLDVVCPRCGQAVSIRLYGPCDSCRHELRSSQAREKGALETTEYVPKMNVTPNSVASKD